MHRDWEKEDEKEDCSKAGDKRPKKKMKTKFGKLINIREADSEED